MKQTYFAEPKYDYDGTAHIVFMSDIHVGGNRAPAPRNFLVGKGPRDEDAEPHRLTLAQEYLDSCWRHMVAHLPRRYIFVFDGDLISGIRKGVIGRNWTNSPDEQRDAGVQLLEPIVRKAERTYIAWGTPFHQPDFSTAEGEAAKLLREKTKKPVKFAEVHNIEIFGYTINVLHSRATVQDYPSSPMDKELEGSMIAEMNESAPFADFIVRAHVHPNSFAFVSRHDRIGWFNLSWQLTDDYLAVGLARFYRRLPMIGTIVLELRDEPMPSCFRFFKLAYPPPENRMKPDHVAWKK